MFGVKEYKALLTKETKKALFKFQIIKAASLALKAVAAPKKELDAEHYILLAELLKTTETIQKRREILESGLSLEPGNAKLNLGLFRLNAADLDWHNAEKAMKKVYNEDSKIMTKGDFARYAVSLIRNNNIAEAEKVLFSLPEDSGSDGEILYAFGELFAAKKEWSQALAYLEKVDVNSAIGKSIHLKALLARAYRMSGNPDAAEMVLEFALSMDGDESSLWAEMAETFYEKGQFRKAADAYQSVIDNDAKADALIYSRKRLAEVKIGDLAAAEATLQQGLSHFPGNKALNNALAKVFIAAKKWDKGIEQLQYVRSLLKNEARQKALLDLAMLYKNEGAAEEAENLLQEFHNNQEQHPVTTYKDGYRNINLFDNGECRIDYSKKLTPANALVITFDTINNTWNDEPFANRFLKKQDVDILTVTKRKSPDRYQDLSLEEFYGAVHKLASTYKRVVTYGSSIGAYSALYFGSSIDAQVIAMAPRNSGHPLFGKNQIPGEFKHLLHPPVNNRIAPYIIYDPNNILDNKYVEESLSEIYPHARFIKCYHAGHNCVSHFLDIGILKEFIVNIIHDKEVPEYKHSKMKHPSRQYLRVLGTACLNHNKPRWALEIGQKAYDLYPDDIAVNIFRIRAFKAAEGLDKAIAVSREAIERIKNHQKIKLNLIDLYVQAGDLSNAENMIEEGIKTYKNPKEFIKKRKKYDKLFSSQLTY